MPIFNSRGNVSENDFNDIPLREASEATDQLSFYSDSDSEADYHECTSGDSDTTEDGEYKTPYEYISEEEEMSFEGENGIPLSDGESTTTFELTSDEELLEPEHSLHQNVQVLNASAPMPDSVAFSNNEGNVQASLEPILEEDNFPQPTFYCSICDELMEELINDLLNEEMYEVITSFDAEENHN